MTHLLLHYDYPDDILERRAPHRAGHLEHANATPELVMGGAVGDPPHSGHLVFATTDVALVEAFVAADPYVIEGIVTSWRIEPWNVVITKPDPG